MEVTEAPNDSSTPQRQQQPSLAKGVAGSKGGFDAGGGGGVGGGGGGKSGSLLMEKSPPSIPLLRPSKKPKRKNVHLQPKPAPLTQWLWGSWEDDSRSPSVRSGGGTPLTLPLFHCLSPTSWTLVAHGTPGDDSLRRARLDSGAGLSGTQRASSGGALPLKTAMQAGGNLDGAWGRRAGPVHTDDLSGQGGFRFRFKM